MTYTPYPPGDPMRGTGNHYAPYPRFNGNYGNRRITTYAGGGGYGQYGSYPSAVINEGPPPPPSWQDFNRGFSQEQQIHNRDVMRRESQRMYNDRFPQATPAMPAYPTAPATVSPKEVAAFHSTLSRYLSNKKAMANPLTGEIPSDEELNRMLGPMPTYPAAPAVPTAQITPQSPAPSRGVNSIARAAMANPPVPKNQGISPSPADASMMRQSFQSLYPGDTSAADAEYAKVAHSYHINAEAPLPPEKAPQFVTAARREPQSDWMPMSSVPGGGTMYSNPQGRWAVMGANGRQQGPAHDFGAIPIRSAQGTTGFSSSREPMYDATQGPQYPFSEAGRPQAQSGQITSYPSAPATTATAQPTTMPSYPGGAPRSYGSEGMPQYDASMHGSPASSPATGSAPSFPNSPQAWADAMGAGGSNEMFRSNPDPAGVINGVGAPPSPQATRQLDAQTAQKILAETGGDKEKARALARSRGFTF